MKKLLFLLIPFLSFANDWGKTGHRIVGEIAERQLTEEVKEIIGLVDHASLEASHLSHGQKQWLEIIKVRLMILIVR